MVLPTPCNRMVTGKLLKQTMVSRQHLVRKLLSQGNYSYEYCSHQNKELNKGGIENRNEFRPNEYGCYLCNLFIK